MTDIFLVSFLLALFFWISNGRISWLKKIFLPRSVITDPQSIHKKSISRLGGTSIFLSILITAFFINNDQEIYEQTRAVILCSIPMFIAGIIDDLRLSSSAYLRIAIMSISGFLTWYILDLRIESVDVWFLDYFLQIPLMQFLFICVAVVGVSNAFNIVDGFNGLVKSHVLAIGLSLIAGLSINNQQETTLFFLVVIFSTLGVFIFNFPFGKIFLGDSGAYLLGFLVSIAVIFHYQQNDLSPWYVLVLLSYPVFEVIFSVIRKIKIKRSPLKPDDLHLHMLIHKRVKKSFGVSEDFFWLNHICVTGILFSFNFPFLLLAQTFSTSSISLMFIALIYVLSYSAVYFLSLSSKDRLRIFGTNNE
ncbi:MAG: glycosyltransferase family 4 protein [SAR86 cluster bacterium]|nr:glycosyltransferase family 4 protein [SAR86 cluster bacterium]